MIAQMLWAGQHEIPFIPLDVATASFTGKSFDVSGQETSPQCVKFSRDGRRFWIIGGTSRIVYQYDCTTAWDLATASYSAISYDPSPTGNFESMQWKTNGQSFYLCNGFHDRIYQFNCGPWSVSAASLYGNYNVSAVEGQIIGLAFSSDGSRMYIVGDGASKSIFQYDLSTPWDVTSAAYASKSFSVSTLTSSAQDLFLSADGSQMLLVSQAATPIVFQLDMSTPYDISTASYSSVNFTPGVTGAFRGVSVSPDQTRMFTIHAGGVSEPDLVREYTLS